MSRQHLRPRKTPADPRPRIAQFAEKVRAVMMQFTDLAPGELGSFALGIGIAGLVDAGLSDAEIVEIAANFIPTARAELADEEKT